MIMLSQKREIIKSLIPKAVLKPVTSHAIEAIPPRSRFNQLVKIEHFPFKVGRELRVKTSKGRIEVLERRKRDNSPPKMTSI